MIIGNIKDVLLRNRENLIVMFIIKNSEGKYLITSNPYFNYYSLPCKYIQLTELDRLLICYAVMHHRTKQNRTFYHVLKKMIELAVLLKVLQNTV